MFSPTDKSEAPEISTVASGSVVSTSTSTSSVQASSSRTSPSATSLPSTWNNDKDVSLDKATSRVTTYSYVLAPSAEVTTTVSEFSPSMRPESPEITYVAFGSRVSTLTSTSLVPGSSSTTSPSSTSEPLTVNPISSVLVPSPTNKVTK